MQTTLARFQTVEKALSKKPWFKKEKWLTSVHGFPRAKPQFITFHVFKKHWFNEESQGVHIESYLAIDPKKQKKTSVTMHVLHSPKIPGTNLKRTELAVPFVNAIFHKVKAWEGYKFRAGKYGQQPFTKFLDGSSKNFEKDLESEIARLCQELGPEMDKAIKNLQK